MQGRKIRIRGARQNTAAHSHAPMAIPTANPLPASATKCSAEMLAANREAPIIGQRSERPARK